MVEVFKTNVTDQAQADLLLDQIHRTFKDYKANFDLEDCDRILRVKCVAGIIQPSSLINLLKDSGFHAEVLPDSIPAAGSRVLTSMGNISGISLASGRLNGKRNYYL